MMTLSDISRRRVRNVPAIKSVLGILTEAERVFVNHMAIEDWHMNLARRTAGVTREFICNLEEG
jgi:hypothetical protein